MNDLLVFIQENWQLSGAAVIVLIAYLVLEFKHRAASGFALSPALAVLKMKEKGCQVVDIRAKTEFDQGHIVNSKMLPKEKLADILQKNKTSPVVLVCQHSIGAKKAAVALKKQGFTSVFVIEGGLEAWKKENMPLIRGQKTEDR